VDPSNADVPLAVWANEYLLLCRRLAKSTRETYQRDIERYVLPRFGAHRLGYVPADEIENWLNDEIDAGIAASSVHRHYRVLRRMMQVAVAARDRPPRRGCPRVRTCPYPFTGSVCDVGRRGPGLSRATTG
jgi:hypothetical protein